MNLCRLFFGNQRPASTRMSEKWTTFGECSELYRPQILQYTTAVYKGLCQIMLEAQTLVKISIHSIKPTHTHIDDEQILSQHLSALHMYIGFVSQINLYTFVCVSSIVILGRRLWWLDIHVYDPRHPESGCLGCSFQYKCFIIHMFGHTPDIVR